MAMQSHHLHTHGPQPLYMQITVEEYEAIKNENRALKQANNSLEERVKTLERQLARNAWHRMDKDKAPVDEYLICYGGDDWNGKGYSMLKATEDKDEIGNPIWTDGSGASICIDEITHWMYMPPEPPENAEPDGELKK